MGRGRGIALLNTRIWNYADYIAGKKREREICRHIRNQQAGAFRFWEVERESLKW